MKIFSFGEDLGHNFAHWDEYLLDMNVLCSLGNIEEFRAFRMNLYGVVNISDCITFPESIRKFSIGYNHFSGYINWNVFSNLPLLQELNLRANDFRGIIDWDILSDLPNIVKVTLRGNYWDLNHRINFEGFGDKIELQLEKQYMCDDTIYCDIRNGWKSYQRSLGNDEWCRKKESCICSCQCIHNINGSIITSPKCFDTSWNPTMTPTTKPTLHTNTPTSHPTKYISTVAPTIATNTPTVLSISTTNTTENISTTTYTPTVLPITTYSPQTLNDTSINPTSNTTNSTATTPKPIKSDILIFCLIVSGITIFAISICAATYHTIKKKKTKKSGNLTYTRYIIPINTYQTYINYISHNK